MHKGRTAEALAQPVRRGSRSWSTRTAYLRERRAWFGEREPNPDLVRHWLEYIGIPKKDQNGLIPQYFISIRRQLGWAVKPSEVRKLRGKVLLGKPVVRPHVHLKIAHRT